MDAVAEVRTQILPDTANPQLLVHVTDENGLTGTGETWWGTYQPGSEPGAPVRAIAVFIDDILAPALVGRPSSDIPGCWSSLVRASYQYGPEGVVSTAIAGLDLALWDLAGRRVQRPVAELLGARAHDRIHAYASLHWLGDAATASADAQRALDAGFAGVKLHEVDLAIVAAVRETIGPDVPLMLDVSARWSEGDAPTQVAGLGHLDLTWIEEPIFPPQDHLALGRLSAQVGQRLAAGENEFSLAGFERLAGTGGVSVLQPDLAKCGGLSPAAQIAQLAEKAGVWLCPHNYSLGPSLGANIHWAMTATAARWIEVPFLPPGLSFPGTWNSPTLTDGCIPFPEVAGLGWS